jgi:predicted acetyltransferase
MEGMTRMQIELRELSLDDGNEVLDMIREIGPGENGFWNVGHDMKGDEFGGYLLKYHNMSKGIDLEPQWVPATKYWLYIDGNPAGIGNLRHCLNENLLKHGGHIGYCIRPSARGKGYGNIILRELLKKAAEKGISSALLTCNDTNAASRRVIESNGGTLERVEEGSRFYWIRLEDAV